MAADFLHGIETIETKSPGQVATIVKSGVIGLIGIAPKGTTQKLTLVLNPLQDAAFGQAIPGFNIPKTLSIIRSIAGNCPVLVINIFDAAKHTQSKTESKQFVNGKVKLSDYPAGGVTITGGAAVVEGVDYTVDFDEITILSGKLLNATSYTFAYKVLDPATVTAGDIIGGYTNGVRTGLNLFDLAYNSFGYTAKIFLSPEFSHISAIGTALRTIAKRSRGIALIDNDPAATLQDAIENRGASGTDSFKTSDSRAILLFPRLLTYSEVVDGNEPYPYSAFYAGVMAANDNENGYWTSPSNYPLNGVEGAEVELYASLFDAGCDVNILNGAGIATVFNTFGDGFRTWGNRTALYPSDTQDVKNFINIQRAADIVAESVELAAFRYSDRNIDNAFLDLVREEGNALFRVLIGRGVFLPGSKVLFNPDDNPAAQLASGQVVFEYIFMVPAPAERITFKSTIDVNLYKNLK